MTNPSELVGDVDVCPHCRGTGQPHGIMGGPEHGLCSWCKGTGQKFSSPRNPSETRDSELLPCPFCGLALVRVEESGEGPYWGHPNTRNFCPGSAFYVTDTGPGRELDVAAWNQRADTIDRLTSSGEAVEVPHYSSKDAEFDRLLALGTAEANEFLTWLKANPGETLSPIAQRALAHTFGFIMDKATSPREGHVEVPVEPTHWAVYSRTGTHIGLWTDEATAKKVAADPSYRGSTVVPLAALPHNQGETK